MDSTSRLLRRFTDPRFSDLFKRSAEIALASTDGGENAQLVFAQRLRRDLIDRVLAVGRIWTESPFMQWAVHCMEAELASVDWEALSRAYLSQLKSDESLPNPEGRSSDEDCGRATFCLAEVFYGPQSQIDCNHASDLGEGALNQSCEMRALRHLFREVVRQRVADKTSMNLDWLIDAHLALLPNSGELGALSLSMYNADAIADEVWEQAGIDKDMF
jgi:hypothetical protein